MELKHAKQLYYSDREDFIKIALEYFDRKQLEKAALPTSWEELSSDQKKTSDEATTAVVPLLKLVDLLKVYNGDWVADWADNSQKWVIILSSNKIITGQDLKEASAIAFQTYTKRDHFYKHHLALIKQAAPLLWGVSFEEESKIKVIGFVVKFKVDNGLYLGCTANHADISTLVAASDLFASHGHAHQFVSEHGDKRAHSMIIQKLTIHKDGTHLLEDIEKAADEEQ